MSIVPQTCNKLIYILVWSAAENLRMLYIYSCVQYWFLDINECRTDNGECTQTCDNTDGSYQCSCWDGYELTSDGYTCIGE